MKKLILAAAVIISTATLVNAQDKTMGKKSTWGIAINGGVPTSSAYTIVFGADLEGDFAVASSTKLTLSGGYENYSIKTALGGGHISFIPLMGGAKFGFSDKFYGHAQLGYAFSATSGGAGAFAFAPGLGYVAGKNWDISVKYLGLSNNGTLGAVLARLAYNF